MTSKLGAFIIDLEGKELLPEERDLLCHPFVGGIILFTRNFDSREQIQHLCKQIKSSRKTPILITVDQEGGRVQRFINEFTRLPHMASFGNIYDEQPTKALLNAKECGWLMATELLSVGVDFSLAPVLDLNKGICSVIGDRAFHSNPQVISQLASAFHQGMQEAGMASTGKHFPGHGSVVVDSHLGLPIDERPFATIEKEDMVPFANLIKNNIQGILASHILFPEIDNKPAGYSKIWLQDILRNRLGFHGAIFSDCLSMEGANISANYTDRVLAAREAGCDFTLLCNQRKGVIEVLDNIAYQSHMVSEDKWGGFIGRFQEMQPIKENKRWRDAHDFIAALTQENVV